MVAPCLLTQHHHSLPRARRVKQSYLTSIPTTLLSFLHTLFLVISLQLRSPSSLLLVNGPGTALILAVSFKLANLFLGTSTRIVFVESWCRVSGLSVTGKLIRPFVDRFCVHWEGVMGQGKELVKGVMFEGPQNREK